MLTDQLAGLFGLIFSGFAAIGRPDTRTRIHHRAFGKVLFVGQVAEATPQGELPTDAPGHVGIPQTIGRYGSFRSVSGGYGGIERIGKGSSHVTILHR